MESINNYRVVTTEELDKLHEQSLDILQNKGCRFDSDEAIEVFKKNGFRVEGKVVFFTKEQVMTAIELAPSKFKHQAINDKRSVIVGGEETLCQPPAGEVFIQDYKGERREPLQSDYANLMKVYQAMENMNMVGSTPMSISDVKKSVASLYCILEMAKNSDKPWVLSTDVGNRKMLKHNFELLEIIFGKDYLKDHYVAWGAACPNSPLVYSQFACDAIIESALWNQPVLITSAPMAGISAPLSVYGVALVGNTEMLAGLVLAQLVTPGVPVMTTVSNICANMQRATWESAAPETTLATLIGIQILKEKYKLPVRVITGGTASKAVDYQAAMETMQGYMISVLAGMQLSNHNIGTLDNLMTTSLEKVVLDDEMMSRVKKIYEGVNTSDSDKCYELIMNTDFEGVFLQNKHTVKNCRKLWRPTISNLDGYEGWVKSGAKDSLEIAHEKVVKILNEAPESMISKELEEEIIDFIKEMENKY